MRAWKSGTALVGPPSGIGSAITSGDEGGAIGLRSRAACVLGGGSMRRCGRRAFQHVVRPPARRFLGLWGWAGGGGHGGLWVLAAVCGNGLEITF